MYSKVWGPDSASVADHENVRELCQLVARNRPALLRHQVREQDAALPAGEALLVEGGAVRLDRNPLRQRDPEIHVPSFRAFLAAH